MRARRAAGPLIVGLLAALGPVACSDDAGNFCTALKNDNSLTAIADSIASRNIDAARNQVARLQRLAESAPQPPRDDLVAVAEAVQRIVDAVGATGAGRSESIDQLNPELAGRYSEASRRVAAWALENCGVDLR